MPGLYDPRFEHDSCGVSFVVDMLGRRSHNLVELAFQSLCNLEHRGAQGAEAETGDGAGILIQVPDAFLRAVVDFDLPPEGAYATGMLFLARDEALAADQRDAVAKLLADEGFSVLGRREVPINPDGIGASARAAMPAFEQIFVAKDDTEAGR